MKSSVNTIANLSLVVSIAILVSVPLSRHVVQAAPTMPVAENQDRSTSSHRQVLHRSIEIDGLDIFYREAGPADAPTILLLHGFPTSSHMFRNLIPALADEFHLIAPDYPGYGNSSMPSLDEFDYSFDHFAKIIDKFTDKLGLDKYSLYLMDYGAPVGFRLAAAHPERIESLIIQNGNAYVEGIDNDFWEPIKEYWRDRSAVNKGLDNEWWENVKAAYKKPNMSNEEALRFLVTLGATQWQYTNGVRNEETISPDNWHVTQRLLDRPGNAEIQLQLFYDYGSNPPLYSSWQAYFRQHQPPTLIVWGANDEIFPAEGAHPYKRDLKDLEFHLLDTGHFALEEDGQEIAELMRSFLRRRVSAAD
ncbi:MAG: alpha/beta hydrolase [Phycisphaerales bacterium]